jgi:hypothetical protein
MQRLDETPKAICSQGKVNLSQFVVFTEKSKHNPGALQARGASNTGRDKTSTLFGD